MRAGQAPLADEPAECVGLGLVGSGRLGDLLRVCEPVPVPVEVPGDQPSEHSARFEGELVAQRQVTLGLRDHHVPWHQAQAPPDPLIGAVHDGLERAGVCPERKEDLM